MNRGRIGPIGRYLDTQRYSNTCNFEDLKCIVISLELTPRACLLHEVCKAQPHARTTMSNPQLHNLRSIPLYAIRKRPALALQLLILLQINPLLRHHRNTILIHTPRVPVKQHLHALSDNLHRPLPIQLRHARLIRHDLAHHRLRQMRPKPRRQARAAKRRAQQIHTRQERLLVVAEAGNEDVVPQRVEVGAPLVHHLAHVRVQVLPVQRLGVRRSGVVRGIVGRGAVGGVVLADGEGEQQPVEVLHVRDVAAEAEDGGFVEGAEALDVGEAGEGAV